MHAKHLILGAILSVMTTVAAQWDNDHGIYAHEAYREGDDDHHFELQDRDAEAAEAIGELKAYLKSRSLAHDPLVCILSNLWIDSSY